jgi:hypothetical protein
VTHKLANPKQSSHNTSSLINTSGQMAVNTWPSDMHWIIIRAIIERRLLGIYYEPGARIIEPWAYGLSREHHGLLRAFQIHILAEQFDRLRPEYRRDDKVMMGGIYCQL